MTPEQIKEGLSRNFVRLIACRSGFKCMGAEPDHGTDLRVIRALPRPAADGRVRYADTGESIDLQLKTTCEHLVTSDGKRIKYELEAKTYNDLVARRLAGFLTPLYLVLLVLPDDPDDWVRVTDKQLAVRRKAFWYRPPRGASETTNKRSIVIEIPLSNVVDLDFMAARFSEIYP